MSGWWVHAWPPTAAQPQPQPQLTTPARSLSGLGSQVALGEESPCHRAVGQQLDVVLRAEFGHPVLGAPVQQTVLHLQGGTAGAAAISEAAQVGACCALTRRRSSWRCCTCRQAGRSAAGAVQWTVKQFTVQGLTAGRAQHPPQCRAAAICMMACLIVDDAHTRLRHLPHALHIKVGGAHVLHLAPLLQAPIRGGGQHDVG